MDGKVAFIVGSDVIEGAALLEQWLGNRLRAISRCNSRASVVEMGHRNPGQSHLNHKVKLIS